MLPLLFFPIIPILGFLGPVKKKYSKVPGTSSGKGHCEDWGPISQWSRTQVVENGQVLRRNKRSLLKTQDTKNQTEEDESEQEDGATLDVHHSEPPSPSPKTETLRQSTRTRKPPERLIDQGWNIQLIKYERQLLKHGTVEVVTLVCYTWWKTHLINPGDSWYFVKNTECSERIYFIYTALIYVGYREKAKD